MAKDKEKILAGAQKLIQKGQLDKAIKEYQKALEEDRKDVRIHLKLGDLFAKLKNNDAAIKAYAEAAKYYSKDGFYSKAVAVYKQALGIDDTRVELYLSLADLYHKLGLVNDAMTQFHTVVAFYERNGQIKEALDTLKHMVDMDPKNVILVTKLAELYYKNAMKDEGYQAFRQALEQLKAENRFEEYTRLLEKLAKADPENLQNLRELSAIYIRRQVWDRAYQVLGRIYKTDPEDLDNLSNLAQVAVRLNQNDQAAEMLKALAGKYRSKGLNQKATETLRKVLQVKPDDPDARRVLGAAASEPAPPEPEISGEPELLEEEIAGDLEALDEVADEEVTIQTDAAPVEEPEAHLTPDQIQEHLTEADVYLKYGLKDKALHHINVVLKADPENYKALTRLKDIHLETGEVTKAIGLLLKMAESGHKQKDFDAARLAVDQILKLDPKHAKAQELKQTLAKAAPASAPPRAEATVKPKVVEEAAEEETDLAVDLDIEEPVEEKAPVPKAKPAPAAPAKPEPVAKAKPAAPAAPAKPEPVKAVKPAPAPSPKPEPVAPPKPAPAAKAVAVPVSVPAEADFSEELEEAEFYIQQGLDDEARKTFLEILKQNPNHAFSLRKLKELDERLSQVHVLEEEEVVQQGPTPAFTDQALAEPEEEVEKTKAEEPEIEEPEIEEEVLVEEEEVVEEEIEVGASEAHVDKEPSKVVSAPVAKKEAPAPVLKEAAEEVVEEEEEGPLEIELETKPGEKEAVATQAPPLEKVEKAAAKVSPPAAPIEPELPEIEEETAKPPEPETPPVEPEVPEVPVEAAAETPEPVMPPSEPQVPEVAAEEVAEEPEPEPEPPPPPSPAVEESQFIPPVLAEGDDLFGPSKSGDELFNLAAELESEDLGEVSSEISGVGASTSEQFHFEDMFRAFKKGVANLVSPEESSAHYDLGLAYKDMGLIEDAITEFQTAMAGSASPSNCLLMIGLCQVDRGQLAEAVASLQQALTIEGLTERENMGLYYELGKIFEKSQDLPRAKWAFEEAQRIDPGFQDVAEKLAGLAEVTPQAPDQPAAAEPEPSEAEAAETPPVLEETPAEAPIGPGPVREDVRRETAALDEAAPAEAEQEPAKPMQQKKSRKISYV